MPRLSFRSRCTFGPRCAFGPRFAVSSRLTFAAWLASAAAGPKGPTTSEGVQLALEVRGSPVLAEDAKTRLLAEIMNHESTHGRCTKTFIKKIRKQTRPAQ